MELFNTVTNVRNQRVKIPGINSGPSIFLKRLDEIHPIYGGNKIFKLKYHIQEAVNTNKNTLLSFGGAFSNHLFALAGLSAEINIPSIGIVSGYPHYSDNPTLSYCAKQGMKLYYLSPRKFYDSEERKALIREISNSNEGIYIIPDGGTDELGIKGAQDMIGDSEVYNNYCIGVGTGGSMSGLIRKLNGNGRIIGFLALKDNGNVKESITGYTKNYPKNWDLFSDYHYGGFSKQNTETLKFKEDFEVLNSLEIDPVYQVKMLLGLKDLIKKEYFSREETLLVFHTGGIQAKKGYDFLAK